MISNERLEEIRDFDTCVTLEESSEMATRLLAIKPIYQERRFHVSGKKHIEYWADIDKGTYQYVHETQRRIIHIQK
nr:MAG TPA: hypothetical protein [Caudoviricetes sp.]